MNQVLGVLGGGYVGLAVGVGFAERGYPVVLVESNPVRYGQLTQGSFFSAEKDLVEAFKQVRRSGRLEITNELTRLQGSPFVFICVGTPQGENGETDTSQLWTAVEQTAPVLADGAGLVIKSTVPVGTGDEIQSFLDSRGKNAHVISYPEFLREGSALKDFRHPSRVVLGGDGHHSSIHTLRQMISEWALPILVTSRREAEMIKYAGNAFLATKISFINEIAKLCEELGADVQTVARGIGLDPRIGQSYLGAGIGFGGPCLPKDLKSLISQGRACGVDSSLLRAVLEVNEQQPQWVLDQINGHLPLLPNKCLAVWGVSFKGGTEDIRGSSALPVMESLLAQGWVLQIHDPYALQALKQYWGETHLLDQYRESITWHQDRWMAAQGADGLLILTDWPEFREGQLERLAEMLGSALIIDGRNLFPPELMNGLGLRYISVGRKVRT